jgi:hypothetical protein
LVESARETEGGREKIEDEKEAIPK